MISRMSGGEGRGGERDPGEKKRHMWKSQVAWGNQKESFQIRRGNVKKIA